LVRVELILFVIAVVAGVTALLLKYRRSRIRKLRVAAQTGYYDHDAALYAARPGPGVVAATGTIGRTRPGPSVIPPFAAPGTTTTRPTGAPLLEQQPVTPPADYSGQQ
jgi:hypothetical protein